MSGIIMMIMMMILGIDFFDGATSLKSHKNHQQKINYRSEPIFEDDLRWDQ